MKDTPKRSNEPVVWLLFGAGTTVSAMFYPVLVLVLGFLLPFGLIDPKNTIELVTFLHTGIGKLLLLVLLIFPMWGAMHRIHHGMHDFKIHIPASGVIFYGLSTLYTVLVCFAVFSL
ncbi:fumarate reductase subunit D [Pasteurella canis]|uniref:fumarate reductase subunit FrdD n=1 Tax=Pasteurella canis TaxID=753 RepID=UPI001E520446|nr:fumarate reductase subunit FrdD [Pasteurella canis]GJJ81278.1 fumarate reductase subunit D [Pasteurella canis]